MSVVRFSNQMPSIFDRVFDANLASWANNNVTVPSVNIKESKDGFDVEVAAPGFEKSDFNIEINENVLTIASEKKVENEVKKEDEQYTRREYKYESFKRSFTLPETADGDKIEAEYNNGILNICIPKKEEAKPKPKRMIEVK